MTISLTILGCGSSGGVPRVASGWGACDPHEPRNRRRRCSALFERRGKGGVTRVLIDTSPDLREQLIDAGVDALDAVLYTHEHADHTHGIDDLRAMVIHNRRRIDIHADGTTLDLLMARFNYCFVTPPGSDYPPILNARRLEREKPLLVQGDGGDILIHHTTVRHGEIDALAFKVGAIAYLPDVSAIPDEAVPFFENLDIWILDALRPKPHPTHFSLAEALAWAKRMRPRRMVLTNLHTDLDYNRLRAELPAGIEPAYDGMVLE